MRFLYTLIILLVLSACKLSKSSIEAIDQQSSKTVVAGTDTLHLTLPDSLRGKPYAPHTLVQRLGFGKLKNKGTIIIQNGSGSVASSVGKASAPVAVAAHEASAEQVLKPKAPVSNSPATEQKSGGSSWLMLVLLALSGLWAWSNYKK